jgi:hypothetical protein
MLSQKLTALNIQDLQYDFRVSKTLVRRGNYAANRGIVWYGRTLPLPRFFDAHASTQAGVVCDDALRVNAARLFVCIVSAMRVWASRAA